MAVYDGFFDAELDEDSVNYDRTYNSEHFTAYFEKIIGSGVCIHNDPDSFKVRFADGAAVVSPGYLFIQGYWLKNDADYSIPLTGTATLAIAARLNLGRRMIELEAVSAAQAYPDTLVLALVNPAAGTAEDTRHNTDLCGVIDTAGELSQKVEWALNYIDSEIEDKLAAAEADIAAQAARLEAEIAKVQAQVDSIVPPAVGTIQFFASQDVGPEWLKCNGEFISESQYPELVAALGKLTPSGDKFQLLSNGQIGPQISNGVLYNGRMWVYSYSTKKLYGVDLEGGGAIKEIAVSSTTSGFNSFLAPSVTSPLALSIVPSLSGTGATLFLAQIIADGYGNSFSSVSSYNKYILIYGASFSGTETSLSLSPPFTSITGYMYAERATCVPYVVSALESGKESFFCITHGSSHVDNDKSVYTMEIGSYLKWTSAGGSATRGSIYYASYVSSLYNRQRIAFSKKNKGDAIAVVGHASSSTSSTYTLIGSLPSGRFDRGDSSGASAPKLTVPCAINIGGASKVLFEYSLSDIPVIPINTLSAWSSSNQEISLPDAARIFVDGAAYLWGKDIYMFFVGTGIIFSRTLEEGSFGYLDTTSVLGTITQFGYLDYSQDEGTLYLLGQDTSNQVKVAKIVLNTLYDYANDGAWLPMIASDGVPAYIKAEETDSGVIFDPVDLKVTVSAINQYVDILFNGEALLTTGTFSRKVSESGTFTVGLRRKNSGSTYYLYLNDTRVITSNSAAVGTVQTVTLNTSDYIAGGITLAAKSS